MLNGHMYIEDTYDEIYHQMLKDVFRAPNHEVAGISYTLKDPTNLGITNSVRAFDTRNAEKFYQWILSGSSDMQVMKDITKRAIQFDREVDGRNPHYGPRIARQIDEVVNELFERPDSRRACILILDAKDQEFLSHKREGNTIEYPCTISLTYFIRNSYLHAHTVMRSNNVCSTICYDNYIFCRLQAEIVYRLNLKIDLALKGDPIHIGFYLHYIINAHIVKGEFKRSAKILEERYGEVTKLTRVD